MPLVTPFERRSAVDVVKLPRDRLRRGFSMLSARPSPTKSQAFTSFTPLKKDILPHSLKKIDTHKIISTQNFEKDEFIAKETLLHRLSKK